MPHIFDNIEQDLLSALVDTMKISDHADFCVGYFNLRGWRSINQHVEKWTGGDRNCCRVLVGMQKLPNEEFLKAQSLLGEEDPLDNSMAHKLKKRLAEEFRSQLTFGVPTNEDETALRILSNQIKANKVIVKLYLRHTLHAKLYLLFRSDPISPTVGYLGSSNLTLSGLSQQGELNIDVLDSDACEKLTKWFENRWNDLWCLDISNDLASIIDESWAREKLIRPYLIYIKIAYHLSQEARAGLSEFRVPQDFNNRLLAFQTAAVKIAAHHLNKRGGVLIGDVVGLGKTLMAVALARIFEDDFGYETLIICPKNLVPMWEDYRDKYRMRARVISISQIINRLPNLRRFRLVVVDESHNLRNREGKRYRFLQDYIRENDSKCILLSATPYNKTYKDLSNQLRLFVPEDKDLGIRPECLLNEIGETEFIRRHQASIRSLPAFEQSTYADDWKELMRLYMVRRTRSFIQKNYTKFDQEKKRNYLEFDNGEKSYFPERVPKTIRINVNDQYQRLFSDDVVGCISSLRLPRYGLGNYLLEPIHEPPDKDVDVLRGLSRAGKRLMGFCRTNLFKRLESSGHVFLVSLERHILRNYVFLYAIENNKPLPIGTIDVGLFDSNSYDKEVDYETDDAFWDEDVIQNEDSVTLDSSLAVLDALRDESDFLAQAERIYRQYEGKYKRRFKWLMTSYFGANLKSDLLSDATALRELLVKVGDWNAYEDTKLNSLYQLLVNKHPKEKVIVFSQFADTVQYLGKQLSIRDVKSMEIVTGDTTNPSLKIRKFSPFSNESHDLIDSDEELRVLIATDILSEGQNLQDCAIVVNYDLPWAIIQLIQRAGRVDRIGQKSPKILCYSFLPADGVERLIELRERVNRRLRENAEVVGTDELFFDEDDGYSILDLYNEQAGILDDDNDNDVDLSSYAYQIWNNAISRDSSLKKKIEEMPSVVFSAKSYNLMPNRPDGVLVFLRSARDNYALSWMSYDGKAVTESQYEILISAKCEPHENALPRLVEHHQIVKKALEHIVSEEKNIGGQLGRPLGARRRTYERLKKYADDVKDTLSDTVSLRQTIDEIFRHPLIHEAKSTLNRQLKSGISDQDLANLVINLREVNRLCVVHEEGENREPQIICSLGLIDKNRL